MGVKRLGGIWDHKTGLLYSRGRKCGRDIIPLFQRKICGKHSGSYTQRIIVKGNQQVWSKRQPLLWILNGYNVFKKSKFGDSTSNLALYSDTLRIDMPRRIYSPHAA